MIENAVPALFLVAIVPFSMAVVWGPDLFSLVFGSGWREAGHYASMLAPACPAAMFRPPWTYLKIPCLASVV